MIAYVFPGQGSQSVGMGLEYFDEFKDLTEIADSILGYSIKELCLEDPEKKLGFTQYTQPALYVVNAMAYLKKIQETGIRPDYVAGHSLGEYDALFAAGVFDFATGLKLVKKRGELMGREKNGGMAAALGMDEEAVKKVIEQNGLTEIDIANLNSPAQTVVAGKRDEIERVQSIFENAGARRFVVLNVSGAFHSRYMASAQKEFTEYMDQFQFNAPSIPVISNVYARPYREDKLKETLSKQITSSVRWSDIIRYLWGIDENIKITQVGPGRVLTDLTNKIMRTTTPFTKEEIEKETQDEPKSKPVKQKEEQVHNNALGNEEFKKEYGLDYAYVVGPMESGITTKEMVERCVNAGLLSIYSTSNLSLHKIETELSYLKQKAGERYFGVSLSPNWTNPDWEESILKLLYQYDIKLVQLSSYINVTKAIVKYKAMGLSQDTDGRIVSRHKVMVKLSRPEVAIAFLQPAGEELIGELLDKNEITQLQAKLLRQVSVADDICVETNSAGRTDTSTALSTLPSMIRLRETVSGQYGKKVRIGCAGSIGTPEAIDAVFMIGADFVMTGSINQCTVEAGTSKVVKDMLQDVDIQDTDYIPSGDNYDYNTKMQVMKKGVLFHVRANKLYEVYRMYDSIQKIDPSVKKQIETHYFNCSFEEVFQKIQGTLNDAQMRRIEKVPKYKMAVIFQWYYLNGMEQAKSGNKDQIVNYLIYCSVAMGAFNAYAKNTKFEKWINRHVDEIGIALMEDATILLKDRIHLMEEKLK